MRKPYFVFLTAAFALASCGGSNPTSSESSQTSSSSASSEQTSSSSSRTVPGVPEFSKDRYSYDKNVLCDLELPVKLNGVNIYACYFEDYLLSAKQAKYIEATKALTISESFMKDLAKGDYSLTVYFDEEIDPAVLSIEVMNSVKTSFDTSTKQYVFGKTGDLKYDCDFSTATVSALKKGDVVIPADLYNYSDKKFTMSSKLLDHCYGTSEFVLELSNNDSYAFKVISDVMFFTDYDITTIHSTIESIYGANPLYQYASSDSVMIVDASSFGMDGNALKYIPNKVDVELDCHAIMTLANNETGMSWYKVGYQKSKTYSISFDYMTIGSSSVAGQTFSFSTVTNWGAPFTFSENLLLGPTNDNVLHHYSVILTGEQIQSGTFIFAKWLGGTGYLLVDNFRVVEASNGLQAVELPAYKSGTGNFVGSVISNGWKYEILIDGIKVENAVIDGDIFTIPANVMDGLSIGVHEICYRTGLGDSKTTLTVRSSGVAELTETAKTITGKEESIKLSGTFSNCSIVKATKYGSNQYDQSSEDGKLLNNDDFAIESDGLVIKKGILENLYGVTTLKVDCSTGDQLVITLNNDTVLFYTDFNKSDVWCWQAEGTSQNWTITQDTKMFSGAEIGDKKVLVYEPGKAEQGHATNPAVCQNGIFTFTKPSRPVAWEVLPFIDETTYKFTMDYSIEGDNENTKFIFYRWLTNGAEDKNNELAPENNHFEFSCKAKDFLGFHFCALRSSQADLAGYKVTISSFKVEAVA